jgi:hypothetical protein
MIMNTYSEILQTTVLDSLQSQYLAQTNLRSQVNAAMFSLYYAQGATITAEEKLDEAKADATFKETVNKQTLTNSHIANNLLASATQGDQYVKQSVSNTAVYAANVQIAATAIIRLASDIGNIWSLINAADYGSELYTQAKKTVDLINDTAYAAENTSQLAMEASMLAAEVSSSTVLDKAKSTNTLINNLLQISSTNLDTAIQTAVAAKAVLSQAGTAEKLAEGIFATLNADYQAARAACGFGNKTFNLNLMVPDAHITDSSFVVEFTKPNYPASGYYIVMVKDSKKLSFSLTEAENLLQQGNTQIIISVPLPHLSPAAYPTYLSKQVNFLDMPGPDKILQDADGDELVWGQRYVIFVLAVLTDTYKKERGSFDNFLSAPCEPFTLTIKLKAVNSSTITVKPLTNESTLPGDNLQKLEFTMEENTTCNPEYRCMFLPAWVPATFFNVIIAEQVSRGNYSIAQNAQNGNQYEVYIGPTTTDHFGNPLVPGKKYLPLILTFSSGEVDKPLKFTNALSAMDKKVAFYYNAL